MGGVGSDDVLPESMCKCGHVDTDHRYSNGGRGRCRAITAERSWLDFDLCTCLAFDNSRLPAPGERLTFGVHRMRDVDAEAAPAWPSMAIVQSRRDAAFKREQRKAKA